MATRSPRDWRKAGAAKSYRAPHSLTLRRGYPASVADRRISWRAIAEPRETASARSLPPNLDLLAADAGPSKRVGHAVNDAGLDVDEREVVEDLDRSDH